MARAVEDGSVRLKHRLEHAGFQAVRALLRRLPACLSYRLMETMAVTAHEVFGWRKSSTRQRLAQVFPDRPERERGRIRREAVRNLARNLVDLIRGPERVEAEFPGREEAFEAFRRARGKGRGMLLVIVHSGNWDLVGVQTARAGFPMCFIARKQKNDLTYQELIRVREAGGGEVVDRDDPGLIRKLLAFLAGNGVVAILVDIRARTPGRAWEFLGQPAWVANGLGLLAAKSGAEVVPMYLGREGRSRLIWKTFPARRLPGGGREGRDALLQSCLDDLGGEVLRHPESYFWFNKRWVLEPPGD